MMLTQSPVHHDGWTIHLTELCGLTGEVVDPPTRTALVDPTGTTLELAVAHMVAHLDRRDHLHGTDFTEQQCEAADALAEDVLASSRWQLQPLP